MDMVEVGGQSGWIGWKLGGQSVGKQGGGRRSVCGWTG